MTVRDIKQKKSFGEIPMAWAGSISSMDYLNLGDALSPVMVALLTGQTPRRVPTKCEATRLAAVGTIGQGFEFGETWFWGTGCSNFINPSAPVDERIAFEVPDNSKFVVTATRGPVSEELLAGPNGARPGVYGDPVWLLQKFYRPEIKKKWKLGVILHLSELADRSYTAKPKPELSRHVVPADLSEEVHLITTCASISLSALRDKIDEICACERIVSTSLHGMVIAESYGIPCLYFSPNATIAGHRRLKLSRDTKLDLRILDLYLGLGKSELDVYEQPRRQATDWRDVMVAIDRVWRPVSLDERRLMGALPLPLNPIKPAAGQTIWEHPVLRSIELQSDVNEVRAFGKVVAERESKVDFNLNRPSNKAREKQELLSRLVAESGGVPLSFVASHESMPYSNLGDGLSAVIVAALSGLPVRHANFDAANERLVSVGTIGHAQKNGRPHFWGTGLDASRNAVNPALKHFVLPTDTEFKVHATRGPMTARTLRQAGLEVNEVFGDPVSLLDQVWPMKDVEKKWDLGVVLHISELAEMTPNSGPRTEFVRYNVPAELESRIRIINTICAPTPADLEKTVREIVSCRAVLSMSLHGLVIAESYGIPCAWFRDGGNNEMSFVDVRDSSERVDHRLRDYYLGTGARKLLTFGQSRSQQTNWERPLRGIQDAWTPTARNPDRLLDAFPLPLCMADQFGVWPLTVAAAETLPL